MAKINTTLIASTVAKYCKTADTLGDIVSELKPLVASIKSKSELHDTLIVPIAAYYGVETKQGQRGITFVVRHETAKKYLERLMAELMGKSAKETIEIDFDDKDVESMQAMLKRLEPYADMEVDGKKVGAAKALALLVAEAKDRI